MRPLSRADLSRFFRALARDVPVPVRITLTGGAEAMLLGGVRPTADVDFQVTVAERYRDRWPTVEDAIRRAADETGVAVEYSTDIDRWSSVSVPVDRRRSRVHERHGRVTIRLLDVSCWAVYKLARYMEADVQDLRAVLRRERLSSQQLARVCGESLRASPKSTRLALFRRQVEHFFANHGREIWGARFDPDRAAAAFRKAAGIPLTPSAR